jgi:hypothetical protein
MKDKDSKMLFEAYSKVYIKEEEDSREYDSRYYDEARSRKTYQRENYDFNFSHEMNGKMYNLIATLDYEIEDMDDDWEFHEFEVHKMAYENPETGEYIDISWKDRPEFFDKLAAIARSKFEEGGSDNWVY